MRTVSLLGESPANGMDLYAYNSYLCLGTVAKHLVHPSLPIRLHSGYESAMSIIAPRPDTIAAEGWCAVCGRRHTLVVGAAGEHALALLQRLEAAGRIDVDTPKEHADPRCSLDYLYGRARGQMFGVLLCEDAAGRAVVLRAFSGQYNALMQVPGWVDPVVDAQVFQALHAPQERHIKALGRKIEAEQDAETRIALKRERREFSRLAMRTLHDLFVLRNFRDESRSMREVFAEYHTSARAVGGDGKCSTNTNETTTRKSTFLSNGRCPQSGVSDVVARPQGMSEHASAIGGTPSSGNRKTHGGSDVVARPPQPPTGAGECCAPKLLQHAAINGLTPVGLAEFFVGRSNRSGSRTHGAFFPACADKCQPLLGFMLCGLADE